MQTNSVDNLTDINDELEREDLFQKITLEKVYMIHQTVRDKGEEFFPPEEYHGDKVKDSNHMERIRKRLVAEKERIQKFENRKKQQENKRMAKYTQLQVEESRKSRKNQFIDDVTKYRKTKAKQFKSVSTDFGSESGASTSSFKKQKIANKQNEQRSEKLANDPLTRFIRGRDSEWDFGPDGEEKQSRKRFKSNSESFSGGAKKSQHKASRPRHKKTRHKRKR